jgi:signal transduction histidine kinase
MILEGSRFVSKPAWLRLAIGLGFVVLATLATHLLWLIVDRPISSPLFLAVMILTAWLCGFRIAVFTAILGGITRKYFFITPYHEFVGDLPEMVRLIVFVVEGILVAWLIEKVRVASEDIRKSREELRELTNHQQTVREMEQKRIAREIHDELGQALTGLKMDVHFMNRRLSQPDARVPANELSGDLTELSKVIDGTIHAIRRIASELRPSILDDFGLIAAIEWQAQELERKTAIRCFCRSDTDSIDFGPESNTAVFRIVQEALTNVVRHADAAKVDVSFKTANGQVVISVVDDGKGIDPALLKQQVSLGILGMQERARLIGAVLGIRRAADGGTAVELRVPTATRAVGTA